MLTSIAVALSSVGAKDGFGEGFAPGQVKILVLVWGLLAPT
jgi:hypothetical protein